MKFEKSDPEDDFPEKFKSEEKKKENIQVMKV